MKRGNWVAIDKRFVNLLPKDNRPYTLLEAMLSYSVDRDNKHKGTINGYASMWSWSRDKVRRFISAIETGDDYQTDKKTGKKTGVKTGKKQAIRYIFNKLESKFDRVKNRGQDTQHDTTKNLIDPNPKNLKKKEGITAQGRALPPISFQNFIKENKKNLLDREEEIKSIAYFLDKYEATQHDQHPHLKPDQWQEAIEGIFIVELEHNQSDDLNREDCITIIDAYFNKTYRDGCDYRLMHFLSSGVKKVLYRENLY